MTPDRLADIAARAYRHMAPWTAQEFAETLARAFVHLTHTEHAFVLATIIVDEAEILALACDPDAQGTGEASRALHAFERAAAGQGVTTVFLEVAAANTPARAFYAKHGYEPAGLRKGYYPQPDGTRDDAVLMRKTLP
ncbi:GNAT family N-acetyltransferase [Tropicibacter alexandrii]|uniref:GNAT family N-acetyltransferase n=1 Tax=Tropicibacter alexandrii TaxID=2267683 RepID=UPI000EF45577|nr:GNAT family N-acetyltransferase [Tropicibacter alexandrii]